MQDKAELYTRISLGILLCMFPIYLISVVFNSWIGIPIIFGLIIVGVYLMYKRVKIEQQTNEVVN